MIKIISILIFGFFLISGFNSIVIGCTMFSADDGNMILVGNNGDYSYIDTYIIFYPPSESRYGRVYVGWNEFWWQTGMNDKGLFFASASTSYLEAQNSSNKPSYPRYLMYKCMEECATVNEVLDIFDQYNLEFLEIMQLLIADSTGASVIIEGDAIHFKQDYYQVLTNFRLSLYQEPYPCWRFNTAINMFEDNNVITLDLFKNICDATHNEGQYPTQFSTVFDLQQQIMYLYHYHNYDVVKIFNLSDELEKGYQKIHIPTLFEPENNLNPYIPTKPIGEISGQVDRLYAYSTTANDPDSDHIWYKWDFGDVTNSEWLGPYNTGESCEIEHSWDEDGEYSIKVKAKDEHGAESEWSDPLTITMPKNKSFNDFNPWLFRFINSFPILEYFQYFSLISQSASII
jgi:hypothetical protein